MDEENNGMDWAWLLMAMALSQNPPEQGLPKDAFYCAQPMDLQNINQVEFDDFSIDQLRKATMNRKEAEEMRLNMLRNAMMNRKETEETKPDKLREAKGS